MIDTDLRRFLLLLLLAALVLASGLGLREPWPADEPRFALIAKDMVESGEWLIPRVGGVLYPDKPPLFFWLVAGFYLLTGSIDVALLLPGLLAGLGVLILVYDLGRRLWGAQAGLWGAAALLVTVQFPLQVKAGQIDALLCFWTTLALYGFCRHLLLGPDWRWYAAGGFACGLGVITKGVGFLPSLVFLPWLYARLAGWPLPAINWSRGRWLLAPAFFVLAVCLWLVPMLAATAGADPALAQYRDNILFRQTVTRYADPWGHIKPPWYLFTNAIPWLWLPLSFLLPWLVPAWAKDLKARAAPVLLLAAWMLLVLAFFSLSDGKRSLYIFPAAPALALLAGPHLPALVARAGPRRMLLALALLLALLPAAGAAWLLAEPSAIARLADLQAAVPSIALIGAAFGLAGLLVIALFRPRRAAQSLAAVLVLVWAAGPPLIYPRIDAARSGSGIIAEADAAVRPGQTLGFAGWKEQFLLQWNRPAVHFGYRRKDRDAEPREAAAWLAEDDSRRLLLPEGMTEPCFERERLTDLGKAHRQRWFLAAAPAVRTGCLAVNYAASIVHYEPGGHIEAVRTATGFRETAR